MTNTAVEIDAFIAGLRASGLQERALREGSKAPDVTLPDALGRPVRLGDLWKDGPLVVSFYRGGWCPYCNTELRALQERLGELHGLGAKLVAISPQTPDHSMSTSRKNALAFPVLSDSDLEAAHGFGIGTTLAPELVDLYGAGGVNLPVLNGNGQWVLPVPATFVIDEAGVIRFAHVDVDYRERADLDEVVAAIGRARLAEVA
ncbi:peroxiredoxin-like family protein [Variovorax sp. IB41]|uniref:peroxiredoxin-like family protein n=1 Tax=Variovorax sp. IB41 TaxID=2779370 RepID=UPI0018E70F11|nr:peroxiredoxin-like family protein [Variovorax sp. IB41]MBJ2154697.1 AhpC/TSA family protein [Variovorax sp. IB41]